MARVDKTHSAVGVVRGVLDADLAAEDLDTIIGVGINAAGRVVRGAGQTGIVGVLVPSKYWAKAGQVVDIFVLGDIVDIGLSPNDTALDAGTTYYADADGDIVADAGAGANVRVGFTVEADRLVVRM